MPVVKTGSIPVREAALSRLRDIEGDADYTELTVISKDTMQGVAVAIKLRGMGIITEVSYGNEKKQLKKAKDNESHFCLFLNEETYRLRDMFSGEIWELQKQGYEKIVMDILVADWTFSGMDILSQEDSWAEENSNEQD